MADETAIVAPVVKKSKAPRLVLGMLPTTPVPFNGKDGLIAVSRVLVYGGAAWLLFKKQRKASYVCMGLAGLCLATSLSSHMWGK